MKQDSWTRQCMTASRLYSWEQTPRVSVKKHITSTKQEDYNISRDLEGCVDSPSELLIL